MDKIADALGSVVMAPVRRLSNMAFKHYLFRQYYASSTIPLEVQVCHALRQQKLISVSYPQREHAVWTDICRILFCQAFLYKEMDNGWRFDFWEIRNPSAIDICWKNLKTYKFQNFFNTQWCFLEELDTTTFKLDPWDGTEAKWAEEAEDIAVRRRKTLLTRLYFNYLKTIERVDQNKHFSHYNELLSSEYLIIKKSLSILSPSDLNNIFQKITPKTNGVVNKIYARGDFNMGVSPRYSADGKSLCHRFYMGKNKKLFIQRTEATLKDGGDFDSQFISGFSEPLTYYLALLQCIDEASLIKLMEDLLSDFARLPKYYEENMKNVDLNPWRWGMPDIIAYDKESTFHVLLECKGPNGRLSKRQIRWLSRNSEKYNLNVGVVVVSEKQIGHL